MPLFHKLCAIHRAMFEEQFERLEWSMIASFECEITRHSANVKLHKTTFWVSPDRDPRGGMTVVFTDPEDTVLSRCQAVERGHYPCDRRSEEGDTKQDHSWICKQRIRCPPGDWHPLAEWRSFARIALYRKKEEQGRASPLVSWTRSSSNRRKLTLLGSIIQLVSGMTKTGILSLAVVS